MSPRGSGRTEGRGSVARAWWPKGGHGGGLVSARRPAGGRAWRALWERNWNEYLDGCAEERLLIPTFPDLLMNLALSRGAQFFPLKLLSQR